VGAAAAGFYLYKRNQARVDAWLRQQGINVPTAASKDPATMSLEDLVLEKERLEDVIAEREMAAGTEAKVEA
jgi:tRNA A-37 threonylcarbamoyl transferase component Bud32